jgi:glycosyltransferase involved in cell wall biosynthesis
MRCPTLNELPAPPAGKTGWPWREESRQLPETKADGTQWPLITVVTPSFNQGEFLEATIRSILLQGYPNLEYVVLDGGSRDDSVDIVRKYGHWLKHWSSGPDSGQSEAINRGLEMGSGVLATWVNSDDMLARNALVESAPRFSGESVVYIGTCLLIDAAGTTLSSHSGRVHTFEDLVRIRTVWRSRGHIVQPEVLFPRALALAVGGLDAANHSTMDYELWGKFMLAGATFQYTGVPFGIFRVHPAQKTNNIVRQTRSLLDTAAKLVRDSSDCLSPPVREEVLRDLEAYWVDFQAEHDKPSGRLDRTGLPPAVLKPIRRIRVRFETVINSWFGPSHG